MQTEVTQNQNQAQFEEVRQQNPDGTWFYRKRYPTTRTYQTIDGQTVTVSKLEVKKVPCSGPTNQKRGRKLRPIPENLREQIITLRQSGVLNRAIARQTGATIAQVENVLLQQLEAI